LIEKAREAERFASFFFLAGAFEHFARPVRLVDYERGRGSILRLDGNRRQGYV
jgi:hypothetical protein